MYAEVAVGWSKGEKSGCEEFFGFVEGKGFVIASR